MPRLWPCAPERFRMIIRLKSRSLICVHLPLRGPVYMTENVFGPPFVVCLERSRFLSAWAASHVPEQASVARRDEAAWRIDRKFRYAEDGFAPGASSPVPVGIVSVMSHAITFTDGITRTIWLSRTAHR
jgi:hypothetical protein